MWKSVQIYFLSIDCSNGVDTIFWHNASGQNSDYHE